MGSHFNRIQSRIRAGLTAFALLAIAIGTSRGARAQGYTLYDLGSLTTGSYSYANAINSAGQVAGSAEAAGAVSHVYLWPNSTSLIDLGSLTPGSSSYGTGIDAFGVVAGYGLTASGTPHGLMIGAGGSVTDLGSLAGAAGYSFAYGINSLGTIVGFSQAAGAAPVQAFVWTSQAGMSALGSLAGSGGISEAFAVNDAGQVVGISDTATAQHAFIWDAVHGMADLGSLAGSLGISSAQAINNLGVVVGYSQNSLGNNRAFMWDSVHGMVDLGSLTGAGGYSQALGINDNGQVVGYSSGADGNDHAFVWDSVNGMVDFGPSTGTAGYSYANAINASGAIVGYFLGADGNDHAFLLTPSVATTSVPPVTAVELKGRQGNNGWYRSRVLVSFQVSDVQGASNVASTYYQLDGGATQTYMDPFVVHHDGKHTLTYWSVDKQGNAEQPHSQAIDIDRTRPDVHVKCTPDCATMSTSPVTVTVSGKMTDSTSGIDTSNATYRVTCDCADVSSGAVTVQPDGSYSFSLTLSLHGKEKQERFTVRVMVHDLAGNVGRGESDVTVKSK